MSALIDARPAGIDLFFRQGTTLTLTLSWPTDSLAGRSFTSTLGGTSLAVAIDGDDMTIEATDAQTSAVTAAAEWQLLEDIDGTPEPIMVGTWAPSDSAAAASSGTVTVTQGAATIEVTVQGTTADRRTWRPEDQGMNTWTCDPIDADETGSPDSGQLRFVRFNVRGDAVTASKIWFWVSSVASGVTAGQNFVGIYDSSGELLTSADIDSEIQTNALVEVAVPSVELAAGYYWVALLVNATTPPVLACLSGMSSLLNANLAGDEKRSASGATGQTSLPDPLGAPSLINHHVLFWFGIS